LGHFWRILQNNQFTPTLARLPFRPSHFLFVDLMLVSGFEFILDFGFILDLDIRILCFCAFVLLCFCAIVKFGYRLTNVNDEVEKS